MTQKFLHVVGIAALLTSRFSVGFANTNFEECGDELDSCNIDSTCAECLFGSDASFESTTSITTIEYEECLSSSFDDETTSVTTCEALGAMACCHPDDCLANDAFSSLWECAMEYVGCSTEAFSCDETSTAAATVTLGTAGFSHFVCTIVLVFTFVRMGF